MLNSKRITFLLLVVSLVCIIFSNYIAIFEFYSISGYRWLFHMSLIIVDSIFMGYLVADGLLKNKETKNEL